MAVDAVFSHRVISASKNDDFSNLYDTALPRTVHNHLLDTKIYATVGDNEIIQTRPSVVYFHGFEVGQTYTQTLRIINASSECQRLHIIPPTLNHVFKIHYRKTESFVPGMYIEVLIEFTPSESSYQNDCIRIHTKASSNLIVPIHAYMIMNVADSFPTSISFKPTLIGQSITKRIPLKNPSSTDFEFQIDFSQKHEAFTVFPTYGVISAKDVVNITLSFTPLEYSTACAQLQILISQFNSEAYYCSITGSSQPGLAVQAKRKELEYELIGLDPRALSPLGRMRTKRLQPTKPTSENSNKNTDPPKEIVKDGIRFPLNLSNQAAVSYVLTQQPGKVKAKDLREAVKAKDDSITTSKQIKEAVFEHMVHQNMESEEKNQLRWCVRLGDNPISDVHQRQIKRDRDKHLHDYHINRGDPIMQQEYSSSTTNCRSSRVTRTAYKVCLHRPSFDVYLNNEWEKRHMVLKKFIHAARKVIVRCRASRNIASLHQHLKDWRKGNFMSATSRIKESLNKEQSLVENIITKPDASSILPFSFPEYLHPLQKDDMAVDALGRIDVKTSSIKLKTNIPKYNLKVPQQYKLLSYNQHQITTAVRSYIPKSLVRSLRTGAESETRQDASTNHRSDMLKERDLLVDNFIEVSTDHVTVPNQLLNPPVYHPLHIFNPSPGVQSHAEVLPYSEVDDEYRLCPLSKHPNTKLDRNDVIPGLMSWKRFPSHSLVVMNTPSLSSVYVPRWSDPFGEDLISCDPPSLLECLPPDDVEYDDMEVNLVPTMEMVKTQFKLVEDLKSEVKQEACTSFPSSLTIPLTNNPQTRVGYTTREAMIENLDTYIREKSDNLGARIKNKNESFKSCSKL